MYTILQTETCNVRQLFYVLEMHLLHSTSPIPLELHSTVTSSILVPRTEAWLPPTYCNGM